MAKTPLQAASHGHDDHEHHIVPTFTYVKVLVSLTALMLLTIFAAEIDIPAVGPISGTIMNQTVALVIAVTKAFLVVWVFMGVRWGTSLTKIWAAVGFIWFFLLGLIIIDYPMRAFEGVDGWEGTRGENALPIGGSALPRVVPPSSKPQAIEENDINVRPRQ